MLKSIWSGVAILALVGTLAWALSKKVGGIKETLSITLFAAIGYFIIGIAVIALIIFIIKWSINKFDNPKEENQLND